MKSTAALAASDFRQIFRDRTMTVFLFTPAILVCFVRFFVPYLTAKFPFLAAYHPMIMMFGALQTAIIFGFFTSFIILDEKDENVMQVIRILPVSTGWFIANRLLFSALFSALGAFLMIRLGGLADPGMRASVLLALQYGLSAPFIALVIATYAQNKIEGMAFFKGVDLVLLIPMLSFLVPGALKYIFGVIPMFWTYRLYDAALKGEPVSALFLAGLAAYGLALYLLFRQFNERVFNR